MPLPSGFEWVLIIGLALLILGPGKLPEVAASLGKSIREFRKASTEVADAVRIDAAPAPVGTAAVTQANAPSDPASAVAPTAVAPSAEPQPNVLQTTAEPNVLKPPEAVADSASSDVAPTSNG